MINLTDLINFSQSKFICKTPVTMYGQPLKVTLSIKFLVITTNSYLSMNYKMEHTERACLLTRINIARVNSTNASLLLRLYKIFVRPDVDYAYIYIYNCTKQDTTTHIRSNTKPLSSLCKKSLFYQYF